MNSKAMAIRGSRGCQGRGRRLLRSLVMKGSREDGSTKRQQSPGNNGRLLQTLTQLFLSLPKMEALPATLHPVTLEEASFSILDNRELASELGLDAKF